tara:strand:+ start:131 stop:496 length:366 start_codon:yes stop_codon:yes gene_type:complete
MNDAKKTKTQLIEELAELRQQIKDRDPKKKDEYQQFIAQIQQEQKRLSVLIDSVVDEVWFCDAEGNPVLANRAALRGLGFETEEDALKPMSDFLPKLNIRNSNDPFPRRGGCAAPALAKGV